MPHVVVDRIDPWQPADFPDGIIDYPYVEDEILALIKAFRLSEVVFDQYNSIQPIQQLTPRAKDAGVTWPLNIHERTATHAHNWEAAEIFKKALHLGLVHIPRTTR